jgi:Raf kinase inhibitor-like YbhB/YbcL family protein
MEVRSSAFQDGEIIPVRFTADGKDISPPLSWESVPAGTESLAVVCEDPDAPGGTWVHWILFNLPRDRQQLPAGFSTSSPLPEGVKQGTNDFGKLGYGGPAPPPGRPHRYYFTVYALDAILQVPEGISRSQLEQAIQDHVLAQGEVMGKYGR